MLGVPFSHQNGRGISPHCGESFFDLLDENKEHSSPTWKAALFSRPVLKVPDFDSPFTLQGDASHPGMGVVLSQNDSDNNDHTVLLSAENSQIMSRCTVHWCKSMRASY